MTATEIQPAPNPVKSFLGLVKIEHSVFALPFAYMSALTAMALHNDKQVDWSTLRRESGSVVDPELRETQSDLLFSARLRGGRPLLLYVLLEHQSRVEPWMALRMLRYVVRQVEHWRQQHPESTRLPVIIPLVMFHGPEGAWTAPRRVEDLFELPGETEEARQYWRALVPRFEYLLDDLTAEREEVLKYHKMAEKYWSDLVNRANCE